VKFTAGVAAAAPLAAVRLVLCAVPGTSESEAGLAVTPEGSPLMVTATVPAKPLEGTAFTLTCCPGLPAVSVTVAGVNVRVKSGAGAEGDEGVEGEAECDPPPQETKNKQSAMQIANTAVETPPAKSRCELTGLTAILTAAGRARRF
jgi:hypothetical protein